MTNSTRDAAPERQTQAPAPSSSTSRSAPVQLREALRGQAFDDQVAALAPAKTVQPKGDASGDVHAAAARGTAGSGAALPHLGAIQRSFGGHDVGAVQAHVGGSAKEASQAMGAQAFASGEHVAFAEAPDLHTAAHEAAHVIQQKAGVSLSGGVGRAGDAYERHADAVADQVVQGKSAEGLLDRFGGGGGRVQRKVQRKGTPLTDTELPGLGFSETQINDLTTTFGDDTKLKEFVDAVGGSAKLKELFITKGVGAAQLKLYGGAFFKTFVGCGSSTISHVEKLDGIEGGAIKGCHDEDTFRAEVTKVIDFTVQDKDLVTKAPLFEPIPQTAKDKFEEAKKKYQGQLDFYNSDRNIDKKTGNKRLQTPPQAPQEPAAEPKMVTLTLERGRINSETPLTVAGVTNLAYELRKQSDAEWRNASLMKTTIKGLASNAAHWQTICNEAIWGAIKAGTFGKNWSGTGGGATITGYWNGGPEVDTFFFTS